MSLELVASLGLAAFILTYLAMDAVIFDRPRDWLHRATRNRLEVLLACPWCCSAYTAAAVVAAADLYGPVPLPGLSWLAVWAVAGFLAARRATV